MTRRDELRPNIRRIAITGVEYWNADDTRVYLVEANNSLAAERAAASAREQALHAEVARLKATQDRPHGLVERQRDTAEAEAHDWRCRAEAAEAELVRARENLARRMIQGQQALGARFEAARAEGLHDGFMAGRAAWLNGGKGWSFTRIHHVPLSADEEAFAAFLASRTPTQGQETHPFVAGHCCYNAESHPCHANDYEQTPQGQEKP